MLVLLLIGCDGTAGMGVPNDTPSPNATDAVEEIVAEYIDTNRDSASYLMKDLTTGRFSTRDSMIAAIYWARQGETDIAESIIVDVVGQQYLGPVQAHIGNFTTLYGDLPPYDYNWSAFIGAYLVFLVTEYSGVWSRRTMETILDTIDRTADHRLAQLHNRPYTTNINILSAYFLLRAGDLLSDDSLRQHAEEFWDDFYNASVESGIAEYNGLSYFAVHLYGLDMIVQHETNARIADQARYLQELLLWSAIFRYHFDSGQLAGPYRRTPDDSRMGPEFLTLQAMLHVGSDGAIQLNTGDPLNSDPLYGTFASLLTGRIPVAWTNAIRSGANIGVHYRERIFNEFAESQTTTYMMI